MPDDQKPREMFGWVTTDKHGKDHFVGVVGHGPGGVILHQHLISHDLKLMQSARDLASSHAKATRQAVQLIRIVQAEVLEELLP